LRDKWPTLLAALAIAAVMFPRAVAGQVGQNAQDATFTGSNDYTTPRYEPAGFPVLGGNSDIGFQFGLVGTLSRFGDDIRPYMWNLDLFLSAAIKPGTGFTQQSVESNIDVPGLYGGKLRVNPEISYTRTTNLGYFGVGNASSATVPDMVAGEPRRYFESVQREFLLRGVARIQLDLPFELVPLVVYRYENPLSYAGSKLAADATPSAPGAAPTALGLRPLSLVTVGGGIVIDTRDNEYFPYRGQFHQLGVKLVEGFPYSASVRYAQDSTVLAWFIPLGGKFVFATRGLLDLQFGNVPFYDLFAGGPFKMQYMLGGSAGVRGVPIGRFSGRIKVIANEELRTMRWNLRVLGQQFHLGAGVFFDIGRVWLNYTFHAPQDGSFPGLKWGAGAAGYLIWGQAAVFRIDVAYSPYADTFRTVAPIAVYVEDNMMF
jgi:outer membrane protein assembly factor BamA